MIKQNAFYAFWTDKFILLVLEMYSFKVAKKISHWQQDIYTWVFDCAQSIQKKTLRSSNEPK